MSPENLNLRIDALKTLVHQHEEMLNHAHHRIDDLETQLTIPKLMTPRQLCEFLQISEGQFYAWKRAGDSPSAIYWSERTVRYDRDVVMAWAKSKEVGQV